MSTTKKVHFAREDDGSSPCGNWSLNFTEDRKKVTCLTCIKRMPKAKIPTPKDVFG